MSLLSTIKSAYQTTKSKLSNAASSLYAAASTPIKQIVGINQTPKSLPNYSGLNNVETTPTGQANMSTVLGPAIGGTGAGNVVQDTPKGRVNIYGDLTNVSKQSTTPELYYTSKSGATKTTTSSAPTVRQSTAPKNIGAVGADGPSVRVQNGNAYDAEGNLFRPALADSGEMGASSNVFGGGVGFDGLNIMSGSSGLPGGGRAAFTGLLNAASGSGTPSFFNAPTDDKSNLSIEKLKQIPGLNFQGGVTPLMASITQNVSQGPTLPRPTVPNTVPDNALSYTSSDVMTARSKADQLGSLYSQLSTVQQQLAAARAAENGLTPTPPNPVEDTTEVTRFLDQLPPADRQTLSQKMDTYRESIGLTDVTKQRLEVMKDINATNETFRGVLDSIKNNPDLPKGLALRRINDIQTKQKDLILQLTGQYDLLIENEKILNNQLNQQFDIFKLEDDEAQRQEKKVYDILNMMVDGGSIAAFNNRDLQLVSERLNIPTKALQNIRDQAKKEQNKPNVKTTLYSTDQGLVAVQQDQTTGSVIGKPTVVVPKSKSGSAIVTNTGTPQVPKNVASALYSAAGIKLPDSLSQGTLSTNIQLSDSELKKLEAAGLLGAPRQEQLNYIYNKNGGIGSFDEY